MRSPGRRPAASDAPRTRVIVGDEGVSCTPCISAAAVAQLLAGAAPSSPKLINTCYSLVAPDYGISIAGVYVPSPAGQLADVPGAGGVSPAGAPRATRAAEAVLGEAWFRTITGEVFG